MKQTEKIIHLLFQVDNIVQTKFRDTASTELPINFPDLVLLKYIKEYGPSSVSELAEYFGIRNSSMSTKISKLEKKKLIQRSACKFDKRTQSITITEKAKNNMEEAKQYITKKTAPLFSVFTEKEKKEFIILLTKLIDKQT